MQKCLPPDNEIIKQRNKRKVPYSTDLIDKICEDIAAGASIYSLSLRDDYPSRVCMYRWLDEHPYFADAYSKACNLRRRHIRDTIYNQSRLENIDTILEDSRGKLSTHSAGVAAVDKSNHWLQWYASRDCISDESRVDIKFTSTTPEGQTAEILALVANGNLTLKQGNELMTLVQRQIEMTQLADLKAVVAEQSETLAKLMGGNQ